MRNELDLRNAPPPKRPPGRSSNVLDLRPQAAHPEPESAPVAPAPVRRPPEAAPVKKKRKLGITWRWVLVQSLKLVVALIGAAGFLLLNIPLPERLIGIYFVVSIVYAFDSQRTFLVALIFLVLVAVSSAIGQSVPAENYAVYAFYFLVIGLVAAIREQVSSRSKDDRGNSQISD